MKSLFKFVILAGLLIVSNNHLAAKSMPILDFENAPFNGEITEKQITKLLTKGGIRATLTVPTYISLFVDQKLVSGVAPAGTQMLFIKNESNDYYTLVPIKGGANVSRNQKMTDFSHSPHIQLIWYSRNDGFDAVYTLISWAKDNKN